MPGRLYKVFEHYKRDEWERYLAAVTDWEREEYLEVLPVSGRRRARPMCGIAGIIYRNGGGEREVGADMTRMLQAMKHRGPDSTGFALYRGDADTYVMHVKLSEAADDGAELAQRVQRQRDQVEARMRAAGAEIESVKGTRRHDDRRSSASTAT